MFFVVGIFIMEIFHDFAPYLFCGMIGFPIAVGTCYLYRVWTGKDKPVSHHLEDHDHRKVI